MKIIELPQLLFMSLQNLKQSQPSIDFDKGFFITPCTLIINETKNNLDLFTFASRSEEVIYRKTSIGDGGNPECLNLAKNGKTLTTIPNKITNPVVLKFILEIIFVD